jgi:hypothetical protein
MAKTTNKKLTLALINKVDSTLNEKKLIKVLNEYDVTIHLKFRKTLIRKIIIDYYKVIQDLKGKDNITDETIINSISLLNVFILREFSDVPIPSIDNIEDLIRVANALLDTGILEDVLSAYPKEQLDLIGKEMEKSSKNFGEMLGELAVNQSLNDTVEEEEVEADA